MGSGKTTVGRQVGSRLGWPYHDNDVALRARTGDSARTLERESGVDELHRLEAEDLLAALGEDGPSVMSAAASVVEDHRCLKALAAPAVFVVWLRADPAVLLERVRRGRHRPKLDPDLEALLRRQVETRGPLFASVADLTLDATTASPEELADHVVRSLAEG